MKKGKGSKEKNDESTVSDSEEETGDEASETEVEEEPLNFSGDNSALAVI